ncbi:exonuclease domain-containing protein [Neolewinella lacunae]|uniref:3'-5' exoribonuclease n=1 Tax=Neolewinella lacunae TaxID=1517758 RepID=A0A923T7J2_9BACT|nr:exonuclease domain-containing protein [Neolewinella lacunae]MBC6994570.1 3'-5' exoribonuclease [Neolewinella lacunae]MDN3633919.1 exonuclease domain-containing protein [Neolewinella lacunae]
MKEKMYAIIDVETTGGRADRDRLTEIGIVIFDGEKVVETYQTLINPECRIPAGITELTGITMEMVAEAPKFHEIARRVVELTQDRIFVAHNSRFDYDFIREEFRRLGYTYQRKQLCTVRLTRRIYPGLRSYSLGNLTRHFGIELTNAHRALADATATTELLKLCLLGPSAEGEVQALVNQGIIATKLPENLHLSQIEDLPEACGVYYFYDTLGGVIYVGKSKNIRSRVAQHFNDRTSKGKRIAQQVAGISYELTGSELVALLHESEEIKRLQPAINRAQRHTHFSYAIITRLNAQGYRCFDIVANTAQVRKEEDVISEYPTLSRAKGRLNFVRNHLELCGIHTKLSTGTSACFYFHLKQCHGACIGHEAPEDYNLRAEEARLRLRNVFDYDFLLFDRGRTHDEEAAILVRDGKYRGFAFISKEDAHDLESIVDSVKCIEGHPDTAQIIQRYVSEKGGRLVDLASGKRRSLV